MQPKDAPHESANGSGNGYRAPDLDLRHFHVFKYAYFSWPRMGSTLRMVYVAISAYADANGYAEPSLAEICDLAEVNSHNTAVAAARELEELGRLTIVHRHATDGAKLSNGYQLTGLEEEWLPRPKNAPSPQPLKVAHMLVVGEREQNAAREREEDLFRQIAELQEQNARLLEENAQLRGDGTPPTSLSDVGGVPEGLENSPQGLETATNQTGDPLRHSVTYPPTSLSDVGGVSQGSDPGGDPQVPPPHSHSVTEGPAESWTDRVVRENARRLYKPAGQGGTWDSVDQARRYYRTHEDELRGLMQDWGIMDGLKSEQETASGQGPPADGSDVIPGTGETSLCPHCGDPYPSFNGLGMCGLCHDDPSRRRGSDGSG